ncbi:MAG TPA: S41 family peptidase [Terracidiphilus sp.]
MIRQALLLCFVSAATSLAQAPGVSAPESAGVQAQSALTAAEREQVLDGVAAKLKEYYILPDAAEKMLDALGTHRKNGDYDALDSAMLAARLTSDLESVSHDRHLRVVYSGAVLPEEDEEPSSSDQAIYRRALERTNCGFKHVDVLPGNLGYLEFNYFGAPEACADTVAAAMKLLSHTDALIFDVRQNRGGDPRMVALLMSYLFDRRTHLTDLYNRREDKTTEYWTAPEKLGTRFATQPVYVLISRSSFSAAEQFAYDLRNLKRAVLIGERTGGAAHPVRNRRINDHFFIGVPEYKYVDPVTHADWEEAGVTPDVPASGWNSVVVAEHLAERKLSSTVSNRGAGVDTRAAAALRSSTAQR